MHRCSWEGSTVVAVHNFSSEPVTVDFALDPRDTGGEDPVWLEDLVATGAKQPRRDGTVEVVIEARLGVRRWLPIVGRCSRLSCLS